MNEANLKLRLKTITSERQSIELTIFVPALNEENLIQASVVEIITATENSPKVTYEIILVDDGSSDETFLEMKRVASLHKNVSIRVFRNNVSIGRRITLNYIVQFARGKKIMMVGGHYQDRREAISSVIKNYHNADNIYPFLEPDLRKKLRYYLSVAYTWLINKICKQNIRYYNGISMFLLEDIILYPPRNDVCFQAELIISSISANRTYVQIGVPCIERTSGKSKVLKFSNIFKVILFLFEIIIQKPNHK